MKQHRASITLAITAVLSGVSHADTAPTPPPSSQAPMPPYVQMLMNLGSAGLLAEMASFENLAVTQGRLGNSRSQIEYARATGTTTGFEDSTNVLVQPTDALYALPNGHGKSFLRANAIFGNFDSADGDLTEVDTELARFGVQYFHSPNIDTLLGVGAYYESTDGELVHIGGSLDRSGFGLRADALHKLTPRWGVAARADINFGSSETTAPISPTNTLNYDLDETRYYLQTDLIGTFSKQQLAILPATWILRPALGAVYQYVDYDTTTNNFGGTVTGTGGTSEEYSSVSASARIESTNFRPMTLAPYFELGYERELVNDLNETVDDPDIAHFTAGASMILARGARLDLQYSRHDGLEGLRDDQAVTVHFGLTF